MELWESCLGSRLPQGNFARGAHDAASFKESINTEKLFFFLAPSSFCRSLLSDSDKPEQKSNGSKQQRIFTDLGGGGFKSSISPQLQLYSNFPKVIERYIIQSDKKTAV